MNKLKLDWQRAVSVRTGVKSWFWVAFLNNSDGTRTRFRVVWHRASLQWQAEMENMSAGNPETIGCFTTPKAAQARVETIANEMAPALKGNKS